MQLYVVLNNEREDRDAAGIYEAIFSTPGLARAYINRFSVDDQWRFEIRAVELDGEV